MDTVIPELDENAVGPDETVAALKRELERVKEFQALTDGMDSLEKGLARICDDINDRVARLRSEMQQGAPYEVSQVAGKFEHLANDVQRQRQDADVRTGNEPHDWVVMRYTRALKHVERAARDAGAEIHRLQNAYGHANFMRYMEAYSAYARTVRDVLSIDPKSIGVGTQSVDGALIFVLRLPVAEGLATLSGRDRARLKMALHDAVPEAYQGFFAVEFAETARAA